MLAMPVTVQTTHDRGTDARSIPTRDNVLHRHLRLRHIAIDDVGQHDVVRCTGILDDLIALGRQASTEVGERHAFVVGGITRLNEDGICRRRGKEEGVTGDQVSVFDVAGVGGEWE